MAGDGVLMEKMLYIADWFRSFVRLAVQVVDFALGWIRRGSDCFQLYCFRFRFDVKNDFRNVYVDGLEDAMKQSRWFLHKAALILLVWFFSSRKNCKLSPFKADLSATWAKLWTKEFIFSFIKSGITWWTCAAY
jgi:hypothetical protein